MAIECWKIFEIKVSIQYRENYLNILTRLLKNTNLRRRYLRLFVKYITMIGKF